MKRRDTFRLLPLTIAGLGGMVRHADAYEAINQSGRFGDQLPLALQYPRVISVIVLFLMFEPRGIANWWRIARTYFKLWPFRF